MICLILDGKEFHSTGAAYEKVLPPRVGRNETGGGTNKSSLLDLIYFWPRQHGWPRDLNSNKFIQSHRLIFWRGWTGDKRGQGTWCFKSRYNSGFQFRSSDITFNFVYVNINFWALYSSRFYTRVVRVYTRISWCRHASSGCRHLWRGSWAGVVFKGKCEDVGKEGMITG